MITRSSRSASAVFALSFTLGACAEDHSPAPAPEVASVAAPLGAPSIDDQCKRVVLCLFNLCQTLGNKPNGTPCDDGNACTSGDACAAGTCAATPITCSDGNGCTDDSCNPASGCVSSANAAACDDGDACTSGDTCAAASCSQSDPVDPDDDDACTSDTCEPDRGVVNTFACGSNATCTPDGCACDEGYAGDGVTCVDVDECADGSDDCDPNATCTNDDGGFDCACAAGYEGDGFACVPDATGCSDGTREGFVDATLYPTIAACSGGWSIPGVRSPTTVEPACGRASGNSSTNPAGDGCNVADLCAPGWHVCLDSAEVARSTGPDGCADARVDDAFFVQRQASFGFYSCVTTGDLSTAQNDMWGCAGTHPLMSGLFLGRPCGPLDATVIDGAAGLPAPWSAAGTNGFDEAARVTKSGPERGGVLCCAD